QVCSSINQAVIHKRDKVVLLVHPNAGNVICINRKEYKIVYDVAMEWFLKNEHYEMCSKLKSWQNNLEKTKRKPKIVSKSLI
ncbi:hypothetical protein EB155_04610, partial [archaeon]|nr:hypothetical protein [archaeon]